MRHISADMLNMYPSNKEEVSNILIDAIQVTIHTYFNRLNQCKVKVEGLIHRRRRHSRRRIINISLKLLKLFSFQGEWSWIICQHILNTLHTCHIFCILLLLCTMMEEKEHNNNKCQQI